MTRKNDKEENKDPSISRKRDKKAARKEASEEDKDEPEEGQIQIPKDVVTKIEDLKQDQFYLVAYLRLKTEQEIKNEQQVSFIFFLMLIIIKAVIVVSTKF